MKNIFICLMILCLFPVTSVFADETTAFLYAGPISSVTRLDLSAEKIIGEQAQYEFKLPEEWSQHLIADREKVYNRNGILEKIVFSYQPKESIAKPLFLMNLYVYNKAYWHDSIIYDKILESENYVFAIETSRDNMAIQENDRILFQFFLEAVNDVHYISGFIQLSANNRIIRHHSIHVNEMLMRNKSILENGTLYIPLREVCEALGYQITWIASSATVMISKDDFSYLLPTRDDKNDGYTVIFFSDMVHVLPTFYSQIVGVEVKIDELYNVNIYG